MEIKKEVQFYPLFKKNRQTWQQNYVPLRLNALKLYILPPSILQKQSDGSPNLFKYTFLVSAKVQNYFCSSSRLGSLTLKPSAFEVVYLFPVASEASGGRIPNSNQLHNIAPFLNTNQQLFLCYKVTPLVSYRWATEKILSYRLSWIHVFQKLWQEYIF